MRRIAVVTVGRSDYGIYVPILRRIVADQDLQLHLLVSGAHLAPEFGRTVQAIEHDGFAIADRVEMLISSDTPTAIAKSMGLGTVGFGEAYARVRPDIVLVLGDRFEMHSAVVAAVPFAIPVAHLHGGESTEGAIDEAFRHSITKMSHLHFAATDAYAQRIVQLGEEPWRVTVSGAPALDNLHSLTLLSAEELERRYNLRFDEPLLLVTMHPTTLDYERAEQHTAELLAALEESGRELVLTYPNADTNGRKIIELIDAFARRQPKARVVPNFGLLGYLSVMAHASCMVGNSSSGIIEAASLKLPVVNIGDRQRGRVRAKNVIDVGYTRNDILAGIEQALSPSFRLSLKDLTNPYGDGRAAERIVAILKSVPIDSKLLIKRFHAVPTS